MGSGAAADGLDYQYHRQLCFTSRRRLVRTIVINPINSGQDRHPDSHSRFVSVAADEPGNFPSARRAGAAIYITSPGISSLSPSVSIIR